MPRPPFSNILVARTDRIGDVVLSLPMARVLRENFAGARVSFLLRTYTKELAEGRQDIDNILLADSSDGAKPFFTVLTEVRKQRYDLVVLAFPTFRLAMLMFLAGIPTRVGTGYRWYSFLFNRRVYEHRKTAEKHELEYNLSLLEFIGCKFERYPKPVLVPTDNHRSAAERILKELKLENAENIIVLHPGSGGSARDWSTENFGELGRLLQKKGYRIIVTGGPGEEGLVEHVTSSAGEGVHALVNRLSLMELAAFFQRASLFISNSTGPLHIAAAMGTPVIGFYPPILVCSPARWGPYTEKKTVFVPDRNKCSLCKGGPCQADECMYQIEVLQVLQEAERILTVKQKSFA